MPLRLLSRPSTATRSAIGVVPGATAVTVCGMSTVRGSPAAWRLPAASSAGAAVAAGERGQSDEGGAEREPHAWSGVQAS